MSQERRPYVELPPDLRGDHRAPSPQPLHPEGEKPDIEVKDLSKCFDLYPHDRDRVLEFFTRQPRHDRFWALKDLSFEVPRGCAFGIIGSNGAGKSTLLKILSGVSKPTEGSVAVNASISSLLDLGLGFHTSFTGRQNIYLNCTLMGLERERIDALLPYILDFAELEGFIDYPVKTYSSGMSLRLGFAIASHLDYQIFLIDEVLTVGDQYFQRKCVRKIEQFIEQGRTIVLVSHDLHSVRSLCDRVLWLKDGQRVLEGKASEVVDTYVDAVRSRESGAIRRPPGLDALRAVRSEDASLLKKAFLGPEAASGTIVASADAPKSAAVLESSDADAAAPDRPSEPSETSSPPPDLQPLSHAALDALAGKESDSDVEARHDGDGGEIKGSMDATSSEITENAPDVEPPLESRRAHLAERFRADLHAQHAGGEAQEWRSTSADPTLRATLSRAVALSNAPELWRSGEAPEPMMEYHGDMPLVTGSGEAKVLEVLFLDRHGQARESFTTLEPLTFAVTFKALHPVEDPIFGVAIHRNDDVYVYGPNTQFDRCLKGIYHGIYTFFLHYPSLPLLTGTYRISVALWDKHHLKPYAWHNRLYTLTMRADREDHGIIVLPHDWAMLTHISGEDERLPSEPER